MAVPSPRTDTLTAEALASLPDRGCRFELIEGELVEVSPASGSHGRIGMRIGWRLMELADAAGLGDVFNADTGFILRRDPDTVLSPGVSFVRSERLSSQDENSFLELAPDLAVEVISPSNTAREISDKVMMYLDAGSTLVWVVEPVRRIVTVYRSDRTARILSDSDTLDGGDVLPGFSLPVADIFARTGR